MQNSKINKFERVFEQIDDLKDRVTKIEVYSNVEREQLHELTAKIDEIRATLNQIVGKDVARASIYGVIGSIVSAIITWIISMVKGN